MPTPFRMTGPISRGTVRTSFVLGLRLLVQAGTLLLVARMLGPQQFGAFAGVAALAVILGTLSTFGTHLVLLAEVSKDPARRDEVFAYAVPFTLLCGSTLFGTYILVYFLVLHGSAMAIAAVLAIGVTECLLQPLLGLPAAEHLGLGRIARSQLLTSLPLALRLAAAVSVFLWRPIDPLTAFGYGYFMASMVALGVVTIAMPAPWPSLRRWRLPSATELRMAAGYAALNITAAGPAELDKTLATRLLPLASAGLYSAGARVIGAATLPVIAMMLSALPRLFREGQENPKRTARLLRLIFAVALTYGIGLAVLLWLIAPVFVWIFGPQYRGIEHVIHWLTLAVPGMGLRIFAGNVLMAIGKPWMRVGFEAAGLIVLITTASALSSYLASIAMPLALASSEWTIATLGIAMIQYQIRQQCGISPSTVTSRQ